MSPSMAMCGATATRDYVPVAPGSLPSDQIWLDRPICQALYRLQLPNHSPTAPRWLSRSLRRARFRLDVMAGRPTAFGCAPQGWFHPGVSVERRQSKAIGGCFRASPFTSCRRSQGAPCGRIADGRLAPAAQGSGVMGDGAQAWFEGLPCPSSSSRSFGPACMRRASDSTKA